MFFVWKQMLHGNSCCTLFHNDRQRRICCYLFYYFIKKDCCMKTLFVVQYFYKHRQRPRCCYFFCYLIITRWLVHNNILFYTFVSQKRPRPIFCYLFYDFYKKITLHTKNNISCTIVYIKSVSGGNIVTSFMLFHKSMIFSYKLSLFIHLL